jgi:eukaryotic-like serine/threonine-protein kinase
MPPLHQPTTQTRLRPFKPTQFGRYTLLMPLASGGMGEIFLARLEGVQGFEKQCVIKKILPHLTQEEDFVTRFVNEAKTLVQLQHGSIAQVLDMGLHEGEPYLALEFVDGKDLRKVAARARERNMPLPLTFVLYTMGRVLDALAYAHRKRDDEEKEIGLVHRDVSPQNILISYEGEVKVIDFGLAKSTLNVARTNPSIVLGKFLYMSPEQARHTKVDRRTDLYSVGLCLYELVAGKNPFDDVPPGELMAKVASPTIANIQQVEPLCPGPVAQTVMKALAVDPAQRFQTAEEFRGRLMAVLVDIDPAAGPESCSRFMREAFSVEYNSERKLLASLREQRLAPAPAPVVVREPEQLGAKRDVNTAVKNLTEIARRSMEMPFGEELTPMPTDPRRMRGSEPPEWTPTPVARPAAPTSGLSFAPTPRLKEDDGRATATDRETMPSINLLIGPPSQGFDSRGDPVTSRAVVAVPDEAYRSGQLPIVGELIDPIPVLRPNSPWSANETTTPAGLPFETARGESPISLPAVMTSEPSETYAPGRMPVAMEGRRPSLPVRPVVAPLPQALKNTRPPAESAESTGKTTTSRSGFMWVVIPLLAVLGVAGFVLYDLYQDQLEKTLQEMERNQKPLGPSGIDDRRSREVEPQPRETDAPENEAPLEVLIPTPVAPDAAPTASPDSELSNLTAPTPASPAVKSQPKGGKKRR